MLSSNLFEQAKKVLPGGVNSPVRSFKQIDGQPLFMEYGKGPYVFDVDNNQYIDYVGSWGPLITGHCNPKVTQAIHDQLEKGLSFGAPTAQETILAEKIRKHMPSIELMRFVNSGTEATMTAIRLARAYTEREHIIKFDGCYHGHSDSLLVNAGSGALTLGIPSSPGVTKSLAEKTLVCPFNDLEKVSELFKQHPHDIACIIVEPIAGNMGFIKPRPDYLEGLRSLCDEYGAVLIFDEVMTGFRVGLNGAQGHYKITPDLTTLGKVIGGGLPVGAVGGKQDIMNLLAPIGPVYQAGTLSGNPLAMAAGIANITQIEQKNFFNNLGQKTSRLAQGLHEVAEHQNIALQTECLGGMFGYFFSEQPIYHLEAAKQSNLDRFTLFFKSMLDHGIYFAPSAFESGFVSSAHSEEDIDHTLNAAEEVFHHLKQI